MPQEGLEPEEASLRMTVKVQDEQQKVSFPPSCPDSVAITPAEAVTPTEAVTPAGASPPTKDRLRAITAGACAR